MTQEDKQLLLKDLCARLPYGLKGIRTYKDYETVEVYDIIPKCKMNPNVGDGIFTEISFTNMDCCTIEEFKPYLRPMSSITKEEREEYWKLVEHRKILYDNGSYDGARNILRLDIPNRLSDFTDWLNSHHFDYRSLIPMGLALEAKEGMYKIN